jgi:uncharacterized membrane protein YeaQ/YmgE (transglycosylase-associated protein family)
VLNRVLDRQNRLQVVTSPAGLPDDARECVESGTLLHRIILRNKAMHLSNESLLVIILVGLIAGWLAGQVLRGSGFGLIGDLIVGLLGALIGDWLLPQLHIHLGVGIVALIVNAFIGAIVLLVILRLIGERSRG